MANLTFKTTIPPLGPELQSYDLTVEITGAQGMPLEVFVFKRGLPELPAVARPGEAGEPRDIFISVADPVDLEDYPADSPNTGDGNPYFRLKVITLRSRSMLDLNETLQYITADLQGLVDALNTALQPGTQESVTVS